MDENSFGLGSCSVPGEAGEALPEALTRDVLLAALREMRVPPERSAAVTFPVGKCQVSFETPSVIAGRAAAFPLLTPALEAWVPGEMELALFVKTGRPERAVLRIGGHEVEGAPLEPPVPCYPEGSRGFRFTLSPLQAAALLIADVRLALGGAEAPVPGVVVEALRAHLPRELNVPLTLVEF